MEKLKELDMEEVLSKIQLEFLKVIRNKYVWVSILAACGIGVYFFILFKSQVKLDYQDFRMGLIVAKIYSVIREILSRPLIFIQLVLILLAGYYYKKVSNQKTTRIVVMCSVAVVILVGISTRSATFKTDAALRERDLIVRMLLAHKDSVRTNQVEQVKLGISDIAIEDENAQWLGTKMEGKLYLYYVKDTDVTSKTGAYKLTKTVVKKENFQKVLGDSYQITRAKLDWKTDGFKKTFQRYLTVTEKAQLFSTENDKYIVTIPVETKKSKNYLILK